MNTQEILTTSPLLFCYRGRDGRLAACNVRSGARFRLGGNRAAEIITSFVEPKSVHDAIGDGFTLAELEEARGAGLLVAEDELHADSLWEQSGWSRPAHLLFSQMDISYRETAVGTDPASLRAARRATVEDYQRSGPYPKREHLCGGPPTELPPPELVSPRLSSLTSRRSVRSFSPVPPRAEELGNVLYTATGGLRTVADDRAGGDPFRLLNSFFSWAHLFVLIQEVQDMRPGIFEYDWRAHRLLCVGDPPADVAVTGVVHGQSWVLGPGFVVFLIADLRSYAWLYRHSRAYIHLLIQLGELGQELLMAAYELGLGGWTTPAIHESRAAALLGLPEDDALDVLSMVKLGRPPPRSTP